VPRWGRASEKPRLDNPSARASQDKVAVLAPNDPDFEILVTAGHKLPHPLRLGTPDQFTQSSASHPSRRRSALGEARGPRSAYGCPLRQRRVHSAASRATARRSSSGRPDLDRACGPRCRALSRPPYPPARPSFALCAMAPSCCSALAKEQAVQRYRLGRGQEPRPARRPDWRREEGSMPHLRDRCPRNTRQGQAHITKLSTRP
jgi:hypothetical protein